MNRRQAIVVLAATSLAACSSSTTTIAEDKPVSPAGPMAVYVSMGKDKKIAVYSLDGKTGALTHRDDVAVEGAPGSLGMSQDNRFLYAAIRSSKQLAAFAIQKDGALKPLNIVKDVDNSAYVTPDRSGRFLLTASYGGSKAALFKLEADGQIKPGALQVIPMDKNAHAIMPDLSNTFVFVPNTGADNVWQLKLDAAAGKLVESKPLKVVARPVDGPRHLTFHPNRKWVYVVNEKSSSVTAYTLDAKQGTLKAFQSLPTLPKGWKADPKAWRGGRNTCADIHVTPNGKFVYATNRGHNSLAGYAIDEETGKLTLIDQFPTEAIPREFDIDPSGKWLVAAGQMANRLRVYRIEADGKLTSLKAYDCGKSPSWVTIRATR